MIASPARPGATVQSGLRPDGLDGAPIAVSNGTDSGIEDEVSRRRSVTQHLHRVSTQSLHNLHVMSI